MINELLNNLKLDIIKSIKDKYDLDINENDIFFVNTTFNKFFCY